MSFSWSHFQIARYWRWGAPPCPVTRPPRKFLARLDRVPRTAILWREHIQHQAAGFGAGADGQSGSRFSEPGPRHPWGSRQISFSIFWGLHRKLAQSVILSSWPKPCCLGHFWPFHVHALVTFSSRRIFSAAVSIFLHGECAWCTRRLVKRLQVVMSQQLTAQ